MFQNWPLFEESGANFVVLLVAVAVVFGLIVLGLQRLVGAKRWSQPRGRQPRLAVMDVASIDTRRRLVLVRRDNVEHLLLIGGPNDMVVEPTIVRGLPVGSSPRIIQTVASPAAPSPITTATDPRPEPSFGAFPEPEAPPVRFDSPAPPVRLDFPAPPVHVDQPVRLDPPPPVLHKAAAPEPAAPPAKKPAAAPTEPKGQVAVQLPASAAQQPAPKSPAQSAPARQREPQVQARAESPAPPPQQLVSKPEPAAVSKPKAETRAEPTPVPKPEVRPAPKPAAAPAPVPDAAKQAGDGAALPAAPYVPPRAAVPERPTAAAPRTIEPILDERRSDSPPRPRASLDDLAARLGEALQLGVDDVPARTDTAPQQHREHGPAFPAPVRIEPRLEPPKPSPTARPEGRPDPIIEKRPPAPELRSGPKPAPSPELGSGPQAGPSSEDRPDQLRTEPAGPERARPEQAPGGLPTGSAWFRRPRAAEPPTPAAPPPVADPETSAPSPVPATDLRPHSPADPAIDKQIGPAPPDEASPSPPPPASAGSLGSLEDEMTRLLDELSGSRGDKPRR